MKLIPIFHLMTPKILFFLHFWLLAAGRKIQGLAEKIALPHSAFSMQARTSMVLTTFPHIDFYYLQLV